MYYSIFRSDHPEAENYLDSPAPQEVIDSYRCVADGNCRREIAVDVARNHVRFGGARVVRVFRGKTVGEVIYTVTRED